MASYDKVEIEKDVIKALIGLAGTTGKTWFRLGTICDRMPGLAKGRKQAYFPPDVANAVNRLVRRGAVLRSVRSSGWYRWAVYSLPDEGPGEE